MGAKDWFTVGMATQKGGSLVPRPTHFLLQKLKIGRNMFFFVVVVVNKPARVNTN